MESRAVRAAPFRGLRHTLRRREPGGPRRQAEVARRRVRWDRFPGIGRGKYGDEMGWRRVDHGDVARAAVQAAPHAIDAARVLSSRAGRDRPGRDRKSTRLNSSHGYISYAVFCLKKKKKYKRRHRARV